MNRDQMIAHLSLLGWEPVVRRFTSGYGWPAGTMRMLNRQLRHNIHSYYMQSGDVRKLRYSRVWGGANVEVLWKRTDWHEVEDVFLRAAVDMIEEAENGS